MTNVTGKVISVAIDVAVKKKDGGSYQGWKLVHEDADGDVKTIAKHMNSLKYAAPLKNGLEALKPGDNFTLEQEKEGDFWNPKSVYKSDVVQSTTKNVSHPYTPAAKSAASGSTYSTVEERAQTQKYIVRQSSITAALKLLEIQGKKTVDQFAVMSLAQQFEAFVMGNTPQKDAGAEAGVSKGNDNPFEDLADDIPY